MLVLAYGTVLRFVGVFMVCTQPNIYFAIDRVQTSCPAEPVRTERGSTGTAAEPDNRVGRRLSTRASLASSQN